MSNEIQGNNLANYFKFYIGKKQLNETFKKIALPNINGDVLDIGSGKSPFMNYIKSKRFVALDNNFNQRPNIVASAIELPFRDNSFDFIICTEVLEHISEPEKSIIENMRVLRDKGYIYITAPMLWSLHYEPYDFYRFTNHSLRYLLERNGFTVKKIKKIGGIFTFIGLRICEKYFNFIHHRLFFFIPKRYRLNFTIVFTLPLNYIFYIIIKALDYFSKKDVFSWSVIAQAEKFKTNKGS